MAASYDFSWPCISSGKLRKMNLIREPYIVRISLSTGFFWPHCGQEKSANSSSVTGAVGDPACVGGSAPGGAFGGIMLPLGLFAVPLLLLTVLLPPPPHAVSRAAAAHMRTKRYFLLFVVIYLLGFSYFTALIRWLSRRGLSIESSVSLVLAAIPSADRPY